MLKRLRMLAVTKQADRVNPIRRPIGICTGFVDENGTRRHRDGTPLTAEELAACKIFISIGQLDPESEKADELADIEAGRIEVRTARVPPSEGYASNLREPPRPPVN
jgi:hypothetical protein